MPTTTPPALVAQEVMNNPSLVPNLPFVNNVWPGYKNAYFPGSASANYFYSVYGVFGSSFLDSLARRRPHLGRIYSRASA